jgi:hypothetical protein
MTTFFILYTRARINIISARRFASDECFGIFFFFHSRIPRAHIRVYAGIAYRVALCRERRAHDSTKKGCRVGASDSFFYTAM